MSNWWHSAPSYGARWGESWRGTSAATWSDAAESDSTIGWGTAGMTSSWDATMARDDSTRNDSFMQQTDADPAEPQECPQPPVTGAAAFQDPLTARALLSARSYTNENVVTGADGSYYPQPVRQPPTVPEENKKMVPSTTPKASDSAMPPAAATSKGQSGAAAEFQRPCGWDGDRIGHTGRGFRSGCS